MRISAICAMSENRVIGNQNKLPWHLPADLQHFKKVTLGKPILLGRKTYESIGRPLPDRCNVVITRDMQFQAPGCLVVNSIEHALKAVAYSDEVFIIGGALLYHQTLAMTQRLYLTLIHQDFEGDTFFPDISLQEWAETERIHHEADDKNPYAYSFIVLDKK
jgi:dihydrofolate reductase